MLDPLRGLGGDLHAALPAHLTIRSATTFDAFSLARHLRPEDSAEILAWGCTPTDGIALSIAQAHEAWVVVEAGAPVGVWGCRTEAPGVGHPWLLTGTPLLRYPRRLLQFGKAMIARWHEQHPLLVTWSWLGNPGHHRWLHHLGFTPINISPVGASQALAYEFVRIKHGR